jgi:hypothetical protein
MTEAAPARVAAFRICPPSLSPGGCDLKPPIGVAPRNSSAITRGLGFALSLPMRPAQALKTSILFLLTTIVVACVAPTPPPPDLRVTSPKRGLVQGSSGRVVVTGTAVPGTDGALVTRVVVNRQPATLAADGTFTATVDVPPGAMLLETIAFTEEGGSATDARAVQVGELRPVTSNIERAVVASLSADAFAKLSSAAGPLVKGMDLMAQLEPLQPMANFGDSLANVKLSITKLTLGDVKFKLVPVDGGLQFSAELSGLDVAARAAYGGTFVVDGTTSVSITADKITIAGTLVVTPAGIAGFTTKITSPSVTSAALKLSASGLVGDILDLLNDNLSSTVQSLTTRSTELALQPLINEALGALAGPQRFDVLGKQLDFQVSPSEVVFSRAGAKVTLDVKATIAGSESSPGYVFTPNGTPALNVGKGIQLGLADDLVNALLAEVHAIGLLDLHIEKDFGVIDTADIKLSMPPMINASENGALRLVLGDMIATFSKQGKTLISAAVNAQVELEVLRGDNAEQIALKFGDVKAYVNVLDPTAEDPLTADDVVGAATAGIDLQLDSMKAFLITVPVPKVAGVKLDNLALRADSGYVVVSGEVD